MAGFSPFKRRANEFKYTPRFYDPNKEAMEQRRAELRGTRTDMPTEEGYRPGQYIRNQRSARASRRKDANKSGRRKVWMSLAIIAMLFLLGSMLYPVLLRAFGLDEAQGHATERVEEYEEFNPYTPITVVPNDYVEGEEVTPAKKSE
ncbi:MAG: hypothetical protein SNH01_08190 [Rikenellaceae bacterium]